jgi:hypothetical protein
VILQYIDDNKRDHAQHITADFTNGHEPTALWEAVHARNWDGADLLIAAGANLTQSQPNAKCPFIEAVLISALPEAGLDRPPPEDRIRQWDTIKGADGKEMGLFTKLIQLEQPWSADLEPLKCGEPGLPLEVALHRSDYPDAESKVAVWAVNYRAGNNQAIEVADLHPAPVGNPDARGPPADAEQTGVCQEEGCLNTESLEECGYCGKKVCPDHFGKEDHDCPTENQKAENQAKP